MYDAIIIGAGMSGLAAGIRLAHFEKRVCILERHSDHRRAELLLSPAGTELRRRAARGDQLCGQGRPPQGPMVRLLRQLRLSWDDLALAPQTVSEIAFPGVRLRFSNDFELLQTEIRRAFPPDSRTTCGGCWPN
jgi:2-polyprenyl-6-methoxyphenol hydroxylase-like FAD-dependent oxidoreductase